MTGPLRVTVFDYGAGNLHSLVKALEGDGRSVRIEDDPQRLLHETDVLVLPGVGAFEQAASRLAPVRAELRDALRGGLPALGICLGMQLLFEESDESSRGSPGIGLIEGRVTRLASPRVPQIGWNAVEWVTFSDLLQPLGTAYYANSYVARPSPESTTRVVAWSEHGGDRFPAVVQVANTVGTQFHPEKSSYEGVQFVQQFLERVQGKSQTGAPP